MTARARPAPRPAANEKRAGYVFNDLQSAQIEQMRMALRGLSQIASGGGALDGQPVEIDGPNLAAIFELFDDRLGDVVGPGRVKTLWFDPDQLPAMPQ